MLGSGINFKEEAGIGALARMKEYLLGQDPFNIERIWQQLFRGDFFPVHVPYEAGCLLPPGRPGLGIEFNEEAAANYPFQPHGGPRLRRKDGSFTNS